MLTSCILTENIYHENLYILCVVYIYCIVWNQGTTCAVNVCTHLTPEDNPVTFCFLTIIKSLNSQIIQSYPVCLTSLVWSFHLSPI